MNTITIPFISKPVPGIVRSAAAYLLFVAGLMASGFTAQAASSPPEQMSYQGYLVDGDGVPLAPNEPVNFPIVFRIYDTEQGGLPLWAEHQIVTVDKGTFSVVLGEGTEVSGEPHNLLSTVFLGSTANERYMGLTVTIGTNDLTILPRLRLLPAPYSFLASQAAQLVNPSTGVPFVSLTGTETAIPGNTAIGGTVHWGTGGTLSREQGGSIEIGDSLNSGATPFLDFHYGTGAAQDWNVRLINDADGRLSLYGGTLSFGSDLADTKLALWDNGNPESRYGFGVQAGQFRFNVGNSSARFSFQNAAIGGSEIVTIRGNGRVGIGTSDPTAPLEVRGSGSVNTHFAYFARSHNIFGTPIAVTGVSPGPANYSIRAQHRVLALEFNAFSDARIKEVVRESEGAKDLEIIRKLRVKDYYSVDKVEDGDAIKKGFIAQEVKELMPEAVTISTRFIPDIYAIPTSIEHDNNRDELTIRLGKNHNVKEGDRVQLITDQSRLELSVAKVVSSDTFVVEGCDQKPANIFVYGKEVSDFHILNYDHIFTTGISAIQELNRELEAKDSKIASLEREVSELKKQFAASQDADAQWRARFTALEELVSEVAAEREAKITTVAVRKEQ